MMTQHSYVSFLEKMLNCFQDLRQLLNNDKTFFSKNNIDGIEDSNIKKSEVLKELANLVSQFSSTLPPNNSDNFLANLHKHSESFQPEIKNQIRQLATNLESEMMECYESLSINNKIVISNVQKLKEFWGKLSAFKLESECVYDAKANTHVKI